MFGYKNTYHGVTIVYRVQYNDMLYKLIAWEQ